MTNFIQKGTASKALLNSFGFGGDLIDLLMGLFGPRCTHDTVKEFLNEMQSETDTTLRNAVGAIVTQTQPAVPWVLPSVAPNGFLISSSCTDNSITLVTANGDGTTFTEVVPTEAC